MAAATLGEEVTVSRVVDHIRGNAVAYVALFVALTGSAYAAIRLPANSVGARQLKKGAVTRKKLAARSVTAASLAPGSVTAASLAAGVLTGFVKASDAISAGDLRGTYGAPTIAPGAVSTADLAPGAVTATKLAANAVTDGSVAPNSLTGASIDESTLSGIGAGVMTGRLDGLSPSGVSGGSPVGTSSASSASITTYQTVSPSIDLVARDFTFRLSVAPGPGAFREMHFVVGAGATVMCTISGTNTTCTAPGPVSLPAGSPFSVQTVPQGSPASADLSFGYVLTTP